MIGASIVLTPSMADGGAASILFAQGSWTALKSAIDARRWRGLCCPQRSASQPPAPALVSAPPATGVEFHVRLSRSRARGRT